MEIKTLTKEIGILFAKEIVQIHNLIPFQRWTIEDFLLEQDEKRIYKHKWQISSVCSEESILVGICVAFEDNQSIIYNNNNFLYLHRIAVLPEYRLQGIGRDLIKHTCKNFFILNPLENKKKVIVMTPIMALNNIDFENSEGFYRKLGFTKIGEKHYKNKIDSILMISLTELIT
jgi:ribosomal protein S18 acetylase RimI-like enzyme